MINCYCRHETTSAQKAHGNLISLLILGPELQQPAGQASDEFHNYFSGVPEVSLDAFEELLV